MAMTAYLDESGTHGVSSAAVVLGGFLATEQGWTAYERELASLLQRHQVGYFHAKLLRKRRGPFKHFTEAQQAIFTLDFFDLVNKHLAYGFAVSLTPKDFLEVYRANKRLPKRFRHDSQYAVCFRFCMSIIRTFMLKTAQPGPVTVVLEDGHKNAQEVVRVYNEQKEELERGEGDTTFGLMALAKKDCARLAAADGMVHGLFRGKNTGITIPGTKRSSSITIKASVPEDQFLKASGQTRIQHFSLTRDQLAALTELYIGQG